MTWLYAGRDAECARAPQLWICTKEEKVAGQQGCLPVALNVDNKVFSAGWGIELIVHPALRLRGFGGVLIEKVFEEHDVILGLEVSDSARRAFLRGGWHDLQTVPLFVMPLKASALFERHFSKVITRVFGYVVGLIFPLLFHMQAWWLRLWGWSFEQINGFGEEWDKAYLQIKSGYRVFAERDSSYLNWRFVKFPCKNRYRMFYIRRHGKIRGYAVLREGTRHGSSVGYIVDYFCCPQEAGNLFFLCANFFHKQRVVDAVYALTLNSKAHKSIVRRGFFLRDSGWHLMFRAKLHLSQNVLEALKTREAWFVSGGDSNVDRPRPDM